MRTSRQEPRAGKILAGTILIVGLWGPLVLAGGLASQAMDLLKPPGAPRLTSAQLARARSLGLDADQVVRLASLVERESGDPEQRALVAGVMLNRLRRGLHLDSQASLACAVGAQRTGATPGRMDFGLDHPANTFRLAGLPAEPICTPSAGAIQAVLNPAETDRLVWFVEPDGSLATDLPAEQRAELERIKPDPAPPETVRGLHYVVSNERRQFTFRPAVDRLGGVWIGVGAEQNYTMAAWSRPSLLILVDFDQVVVDVHHLYRVAFLQSPTPEDFVAFWQRDNRRAARQAIERTYAGDRRTQRRVLAAFSTTRRAVTVRIETMRADFKAAGQVCFLDDPEQYAHLRELHLADRVLAVRGDLTARRTMRQLGAALTRQGRTVRVAYLSNAEQYFDYTPDFKRNMRALPVDEWSLLLRTRPTGLEYSYVLQWYQNFLRWLDKPYVRNMRQIVPRRILSRHRPLHQVLTEPPERRVNWRNSRQARKEGS